MGEAAHNIELLKNVTTSESFKNGLENSLKHIGSRMDADSHMGRLDEVSQRLGALNRSQQESEAAKALRTMLNEVENIYKQAEIFEVERARNHSAKVRAATEFSHSWHYF